MTLDEAIKHCEEVADKLNARKKVYENLEDDRRLFAKEESDCIECAKEHRQLSQWLKELKAYKENKTMKTKFDIGEKVLICGEVKSIRIFDNNRVQYKVKSKAVNDTFLMEYKEDDLLKNTFLPEEKKHDNEPENTKAQFEPCPFCGSTDIGVEDVTLDVFISKNAPSSRLTEVYAYCRICKAKGGHRIIQAKNDDDIMLEASKAWNNRFNVKED